MRDGQMLTLSQNLTLDFRLERQTIILSTVSVTTETDPILSPDRTGAATIISDSALRRLPSLDRTFTDFVVLSPEVSDAGPGLSGAGVNNRLNNIQIDGASENDLFGLGETGQPGGQARGKSIGLESVREYQVLLAPFDVQQGNFGGVLVNAVTRGGTNELHGSAFFTSRSEGLARNVDYVRDQEYSQQQFGFSIGGPILRDRVHFFVAPEFQRRYEPAAGPYLGQTSAPYPASPAGHRAVPGAARRLRHQCRFGGAGAQRESTAEHFRARSTLRRPSTTGSCCATTTGAPRTTCWRATRRCSA